MDIQLQVTDEELKEFPETDLDYTPSNISLPGADLPTPPTDLHTPPTGLPIPRAKARHKARQNNTSWKRMRNHIDTHSVTQVNEYLPTIQQKGSFIQPSAPILLLLSLQLEPDLPALVWTLSPKALRYLNLGIHIGKSLFKINEHNKQTAPNANLLEVLGEKGNGERCNNLEDCDRGEADDTAHDRGSSGGHGGQHGPSGTCGHGGL